MKIAAALAGIALLGLSAPAIAEEATAAPAAQASATLSVETTPISEIIKNAKAKEALEKQVPDIAQYYDMIGSMTLAQVAPMSQGALDDDKLKAIQADFDQLK